jgi:flavin-dependent dehydrogenase
MEEIVTITDGPAARANKLARTKWDAIVIGAGPAGAVAARQIALAGLSTLLVDGKQFPREKVCGGFLNRRAIEALREIGLGHLTQNDSEPDVTEVQLIRGRQRACFPLPAGRVICRTTFDELLLNAAKAAGAAILMGHHAAVDAACEAQFRRVTVTCHGIIERLDASIVICADGLSRTSTRHLPEFAATTAIDSRLGIGATIEGETGACSMGQITMLLSSRAYVGISRFGPHQFNVAAAVDRAAFVESPAKLVTQIFSDAGIRFPANLISANWRGTPPLTTKPRQVAAERVLMIGDAGGYIEPFTGEGMATAIESARAIAPLAARAAASWDPTIAEAWQMQHRRMVRDQQRTCRQLAWILRRPWASAAALNMCRAMPAIADKLIAKTSELPGVCRPA